MAYSELIVQRIRDYFQSVGIRFTEKKMFSGVCFMVDEKMCCGTHVDKASGDNFLLCRIGEDAYQKAIKKEHVIPMEFTGKAMKGYVFVKEAGFQTSKDLQQWLRLCLEFNPQAKSSKK